MKIFCALCSILFGSLAYLESYAFGYFENPKWQQGWVFTYIMMALTALISCAKPLPSWCYKCGAFLALLHTTFRFLDSSTRSEIEYNNETIGPLIVSLFFIILAYAKWKVKPIA